MRAEQVVTAIEPLVEAGLVPARWWGCATAVRCRRQRWVRSHLPAGGAFSSDAQVRISSNTTPMVAALAMVLVGDGVVGVRDPVERYPPSWPGGLDVRLLDIECGQLVGPLSRGAFREDRRTAAGSFSLIVLVRR